MNIVIPLTTNTKKLGTYEIKEDSIPPSIEARNFKPNQNDTRKSKRGDNHASIFDDENIYYIDFFNKIFNSKIGSIKIIISFKIKKINIIIFNY